MEIYIVSQRKVNILDPVFPQLYFIYENLYIITVKKNKDCFLREV